MCDQECVVEEVEEEEPPTKSSKDKKSKVEEKPPSLVFKITSKVAYKTVLKGNVIVFHSYCVMIFEIQT